MQHLAAAYAKGLLALVLCAAAAPAAAARLPRPPQPPGALQEHGTTATSTNNFRRSSLVQAAKAGGDSSLSDAARTTAHLREELEAAAAARSRLRARLEEVGHQAHLGIARLRDRVRKAEAAAKRTEGELRSRLLQASKKLSTAEAAEEDLRAQLASERQQLESQRSKAEASAAKAAAEAQKAAAEARELRGRLEAAEHAQQQLRAEMQEARQSSRKEGAKLAEGTSANSRLKAQLAAAVAAASDAERRLELEQQTYQELQANMTRAAAFATSASKAARHERMGLLEQISELQEESQQAEKRAAKAEGQVQGVQQDALRQAGAQRRELQRRGAELGLWQARAQAAEANATASAEKAEAGRREEEALRRAAEKEDKQLHAALLEATDLREARDAAARGEAAFQQMDTKAEATLQQERRSLASARQELSQAESRADTGMKEVNALKNEKHSLEVKLAAMQNASAEQKAHDDEEIHNTMLSAASKVRELEDQRDNLEEDLKKAQASLSSAGAESARAKDTLVQETDAALKSQQRAESLSASLEASEKAAEESGSRAAALARQVSVLQGARDQAVDALQKSSSEETKWHTEAEKLQKEAGEDLAKVHNMEAENKHLREQVSELSSEGQRADELAASLQGLRTDEKQREAQKEQLQEQMERLRDLKDRYSTDYEASRNESDTWRNKAQDLENQLQAAQRQTEALSHQREEAVERVRTARSQEDEYFEENSQLQQQNEALTEKLKEANTELNHSAVAEQQLKAEAGALRAEELREQRNSHAAWVANERELVQARRDLQLTNMLKDSAQAELQHTRAVLTDQQRHLLGLPATPSASGGQSPPASEAATGPVAKARTPTVPMLAPALRSGGASTSEPQVDHLKAEASPHRPGPVAAAATEAPQLPGEPRRPQDDPAATLASAEAAGKPRSALQRLAEYFASPLQR